MASLINVAFGPYVLRNLISAGGIAEVYRGQHREAGGDVAVKVMRPERAVDKAHAKAFADEYALLARLKHPAIPRALRDGEIQGRPCMAIEFIPGEPLHLLVERKAAFDATAVFAKLTKAVGYLHENGIVHNDLKLENVILRPDGGIGLVDFGNARDLNDRGGLLGKLFGKKKDGLFGTPTYVAPELLRGSADPSFASDIYSLGVCAFMLLSGEPPFTHDRKSQRLRATVSQEAPPIRSRVARLPLTYAKLIDMCLIKDPKGRHSDAAKFYQAIKTVTKAVQSSAQSGAHAQVPAIDV